MNQKKKTGRIIGILILALCMLFGFAGPVQAYGSGAISAASAVTAVSGKPVSAELTKSKKKSKNKQQNKDSQNSNNSQQHDKNKKNGDADAKQKEESESQNVVTEDGTYTGKEEVAAYLHQFEHLPDNYITKKEAKKLGWDNSKGNLQDVAPGKSIGGDYFGNYEGQLPEKKGRDYYECDIDYEGGYRGSKRIIFSNDGAIYYTEDHYTTFEQLY